MITQKNDLVMWKRSGTTLLHSCCLCRHTQTNFNTGQQIALLDLWGDMWLSVEEPHQMASQTGACPAHRVEDKAPVPIFLDNIILLKYPCSKAHLKKEKKKVLLVQHGAANNQVKLTVKK